MRKIAISCVGDGFFYEDNLDNFFYGISDELQIIDKEAKDRFKEIGIDLDAIDSNYIKDFVTEDTEDEFYEIVRDLDYVEEKCDYIYAIEDIENVECEYFLSEGAYLVTKDILTFNKELYHICCKVDRYLELEVELLEYDEISDFEKEFENDYSYNREYHYNFYKTRDNKIFRVFVNHYQGHRPTIDEEWGDWREIYTKLEEQK